MTMTFKTALTNAKEKGKDFKKALGMLTKVACAKAAKRGSRLFEKVETKMMDSIVGTEESIEEKEVMEIVHCEDGFETMELRV